MNKATKILASLVVLVNVTISCCSGSIGEDNPRIARTELVISKIADVNQAVQFDTILPIPGSSTTSKFDFRKFEWFFKLKIVNDLHLLAFKSQNSYVLTFSPVLRNIVLNDIVEQKSHWM